MSGGTPEATLATMLIVDDEPDNALMLRRTFRGLFTIDIATCGQEALELLAGNPVDVIITDYLMPGMSGTEFLSRSLRLAPSAVRVLVTAHADVECAIASVNQGRAHRFFHKPIDRNEIVSSVSALVDEALAVRRLRARLDELEQEREQLTRRLAELGPSSVLV